MKDISKRFAVLKASFMMIYGYVTFLMGRWTGAVLALIGVGVAYFSVRARFGE
jgi:hypothetical protein